MAKVKDVARLLILLAQESGGEPMTQLRLQKMLYFVQGWHLARHDEPMFTEAIQAWVLGPVSIEVRSEYLEYGNSEITIPESESEQVQTAGFTDNEIATIIDVFSEYNRYATSTLVDKTHWSLPWKQHYNKFTKNNVIPEEDMKEYFKKLPQLAGIEDILDGYPMECIV